MKVSRMGIEAACGGGRWADPIAVGGLGVG